jgi:hypothetical protein
VAYGGAGAAAGTAAGAALAEAASSRGGCGLGGGSAGGGCAFSCGGDVGDEGQTDGEMAGHRTRGGWRNVVLGDDGQIMPKNMSLLRSRLFTVAGCFRAGNLQTAGVDGSIGKGV